MDFVRGCNKSWTLMDIQKNNRFFLFDWWYYVFGVIGGLFMYTFDDLFGSEHKILRKSTERQIFGKFYAIIFIDFHSMYVLLAMVNNVKSVYSKNYN